MEKNQWAEVPEHNDVAKSMMFLAVSADLIARGRQRQLIIFGGAGCGKTHTIQNALTAFRARRLEPVFANPTGYKDVLAAYEEAWEDSGGNAARVRPIFFDEADTIFASEKCLNILKVAFAPNRSQRIYNSMPLDAPVFISTNRKVDAFSKAKMPHIEAVFDRQPPIVVPDNPFASWEYACYLALTTDMNRKTCAGDRIALDVQVRALEWFTDNAHRLTVVGPRALHRAAETMAMGLATWAEDYALASLFAKKARHFGRQPEQQDWKRLILNPPHKPPIGRAA
jgi:hypothetical protein